LKIAFANAKYKLIESSGGNAHINQFINNAVALGHEIWVWPGNQHSLVHHLPMKRLDMWRTLRSMDVLYIRIETAPPSTCRWSLPPHRWMYGFPIVVWEFNSIPEYGLLRGKTSQEIEQSILIFRKYSPGCDMAICVSNNLGDYVTDKLAIKKAFVVPNGSDPNLFKPDAPPVKQLSNSENQLNVVWIGSADISWHNFDILLSASQIIHHSSYKDRISFHIIGKDSADRFGRLPPNVFYWGPVPYEQLPNWLSGMDVGLVLYHSGQADFGSPVKLFDYLASGLTVVSTDQPQVREVFEQMGQSDLIVPDNDATDLADKLIRLANDQERIQRQGELSRKLVIDHYNWRRAVQDTMNEIEAILDQKGISNRTS